MRITILFLALVTPLISGAPAEHLNLEDSVALSGYDAVSYYSGSPVEGSGDFRTERNGAVYQFANEKNLIAFQSDPERYLPAYGGWCAYAMLEGDKVEVDPMSFKIINGKNYLFYNGFWGDTLKRWNKKQPKTLESKLVEKADSEWEKILQK